MNTISIPVGFMSSISLYVGIYHLLIYSRRRQHREDLTFALLCLATTLYNVFCIGLYNAATVAEGVGWQRAQFIALALFSTAFLWFVADYTHLKRRNVIYIFSSFFLLAFFVQLVDRSSLTWVISRPSIKEVLLPLGLKITYHEAAFGLFTTIQNFTGLLASTYILLCAIHYYRRGNKREAGRLLLAIGFMYVATLNDFAVSGGLYQFAYTIEYGYMAMILLMTYSLSNTVVEAALTKESLRKSEERFRALVETTSDWVWETDPDGTFTYASPKIRELLGYEPEEILGKTTFDLMPVDEAESIRSIFQDIVIHRKVISRLENTNRRKDGQLVVLETSGEPFFDEKGNLLGYRGIDRDITERKRAEQALQQANLVVENSPVVLFRWKAVEGWPVVLVSQNVTQLGYTAEEFLNGSANFASIVHPDDIERVVGEVQSYSANGIDRFQQEYRIKTKDGKVRWIDDRTVIERNPDGQVTHYQGIVVDITHRKLVEDALRQSRNLLQAVLDTIPARVFWKDCDSRFLGCNQPFALDAGVNSPDEVIGKDDYQMGWRDQADLYRDDDKQVMESGKSKLNFEEPQTTPDGNRIWLRTSKVPLRDTDGVIWGVLGTYEDITERKQAEWALKESEEKYRSIVENALAGIFTVDDTYHFVYANDELCRILDYSREVLIGLDFRQILAEDSIALVVDRYVRRRQGAQVPPRYELNVVRSDGKVRQVEMSVAIVFDATGRPRTIGQLVDITERKQAETERERLITELESKNAELERFTYTVSHDLKSPLVTIRGFLGFLEKDTVTGNLDQLKVDIARIRNATNKMQQLLNELLELSRIGRVVNQAENVSFEMIVKEALELVRGQIEARGVQVEIMPGLPIICGDRARLVEVAQNLIDNAVKFMGDQPEPRIEIGQKGDANGNPIFYVKDNGIGIEPQYHDRVFGLFNKLDINTDGTGVGLALAKRIVEVHDGKIWVESEGAGHGATFYFSLPAG